MKQFSSLVAMTAIVTGIAFAQSTTQTAKASIISVFLFDTDQQPLVGSIIKSDSSRTTMELSCPPEASAEACGYPSPITLTAGPSTFRANMAVESLTADVGCDIHGSTVSAVCSETITGPAAYFGFGAGGTADVSDLSSVTGSGTSITTSSTTVTLTGSEVQYFPVTITAGAGISSGAASSMATAATTEGSSGSASGSTTATGSAATASASTGAGSRNAGFMGGALGLVGLSMALL